MNMIKIRKLYRSDLSQLEKWGYHDDPRFKQYDFRDFSSSAFRYWYASKKFPFLKRIFGVFDRDILIGYITMKKIDWFRRESELGIVFNPDQLGHGYGSKSLLKYLSIYFDTFKMNRLYLKVSSFNERAIKVYRKVGFTEYKRSKEEFEEQTWAFEILLNHKESFFMEKDILKTEVLYMEITKDKYYSNS